jgi:hypothetical protein
VLDETTTGSDALDRFLIDGWVDAVRIAADLSGRCRRAEL